MSAETHVINGIDDSIKGNSPVTSGRGIFSKYTDQQKASVLWKFSIATTIFGITLAIIGLALDRYDNDDEVTITLHGNNVVVPSVLIRSTSISLGTEGCPCVGDEENCDRFKLNPLKSPLHSPKGMSLWDIYENTDGDSAAAFFADDSRQVIASTHMGSLDSMYRRGLASRVLAFIGVGLQLVALIWTVVFRVGPSPFFYNRPLFGQTQRDHTLGSIYLILLISSAIFLFASNTVMSTFVVPLMARVANFALSWCMQ